MYTTDKIFKEKSSQIKQLSKEELFLTIKNKYTQIPKEIQTSLENYFATFDYWGKLESKNGIFEEIERKANSLHYHIDDIVWLYNNLGDYRSKKILLAILTNYFEYDFQLLNEVRETNFLPYFDMDIIQCTNEEVIVDLGAYTGDTIIDYIKTYGIDCYKKIYCYEITESTFNILKNNLSYYPNIECKRKAASNKKETLYIESNTVNASANVIRTSGEIKVEAVAIDEDIDDTITMIKMDIEGSEMDALNGAQIQDYHPKLLISVYHNHEDIWKIPKMIEEITPGYKFYLRYYGNNIFPTETTLIAIYEKDKS